MNDVLDIVFSTDLLDTYTGQTKGILYTCLAIAVLHTLCSVRSVTILTEKRLSLVVKLFFLEMILRWVACLQLYCYLLL